MVQTMLDPLIAVALLKMLSWERYSTRVAEWWASSCEAGTTSSGGRTDWWARDMAWRSH